MKIRNVAGPSHLINSSPPITREKEQKIKNASTRKRQDVKPNKAVEAPQLIIIKEKTKK